jgi:hypothetical protein
MAKDTRLLRVRKKIPSCVHQSIYIFGDVGEKTRFWKEKRSIDRQQAGTELVVLASWHRKRREGQNEGKP